MVLKHIHNIQKDITHLVFSVLRRLRQKEAIQGYIVRFLFQKTKTLLIKVLSINEDTS